MWIDRLDLLAFGHFTDVRLTLGPGFHLIYGPNEAGKSTTLRAIRQLLFGFDERTTDNFVHQNPNLRIGGVLRDESDRSLEVLRRKTRKDSLLGADQETTIDPKVWEEWLCHVDESTFTNRYGIDYEQLRKGGHEIATGTGDLGEILFAAGSGILDLTAVQKSLAEEAAEIFRPQGKKQRLNQAIAEWQTQRDIVTKSLVPVAEWEEADLSRQSSLARLHDLSEHVTQLEARLDLFQRQQQARPFLAEFRQQQEKLKPYESTPSLPAGFSSRKQAVILEWKQSTTTEADESDLIRKLDQEIQQIAVPAGIIECANDIAELLTEWGSYRKARTDRPSLVDQLQQLEAQLQKMLNQYENSSEETQVANLQIDRETRHKITQQVQHHSRLSAAIAQSKTLGSELAVQLEDAKKRVGLLPSVANVDRLRSVVKDVRAAGDLESYHERVAQEIAQANIRIMEQCQQLGIPVEATQQLRAIRVPSEEEVRQQDAKLDQIRSEKTVVQSRLSELEIEFNDLKQQIKELRDKFQVPSESDLDAARASRNELIKQFRQSIEGNKIPPLANWVEFEVTIEQSDAISDRLRREADRVANLMELSSDLNTNETKQHEISIRLAALNADLNAAEAKWAADWPELSIAPRSLGDLQGWLAKRDNLVQLVDELNRRKSLVVEIRSKLAAAQQTLVSVLKDQDSPSSIDAEPSNVSETPPTVPTPRKQKSFGWDEEDTSTAVEIVQPEMTSSGLLHLSLQQLLELADERLEASEQNQIAHRDATHELTAADRQRIASDAQWDRLQAEFSEWDTEWKELLRDLELPADSTPEEVTNLVDSSIEQSNLLRQIEQLRQRIAGIDDDSSSFQTRAKSLFERVAPDLIGAEFEAAVKSIQTRASSAHRDQTKRDELTNRRTISHKKVVAAGAAKARVVQQVHSLLQEIGCTEVLSLEPSGEQFENWIVQLDEFEVRASQKKVFDENVLRLRGRLEEFARDESLESFLESLTLIDSSELESRIKSLKEDRDRLESERDVLNQRIGSAEQQLLAMGGESKAAEAQEQQSQIFTQIRSDVEQFARAKLASVILHAAIERYRDRIRGPVLKVASEFFSELTLGSFDGLRVEEDDHGKPVLVGLRHDQKSRVSVDGMSEGTCDQLYLALRLASLHLESAPRSRLPFIIDDILIQFDDARSAAALKVLARFGRQRQMIFFTHHERLVEIAREELGSDVKTHQLSS